MSIPGTTVSGTVLYATEFQDILCAHYKISPLNLQSHCSRRGTAFGVTHPLSCSIGSPVIVRQNEICDKLLYLSRRAFTSASVHVEAITHQGHTKYEQEIRQGSDKDKEMWGGT